MSPPNSTLPEVPLEVTKKLLGARRMKSVAAVTVTVFVGLTLGPGVM